jgi:hypothetical protein
MVHAIHPKPARMTRQTCDRATDGYFALRAAGYSPEDAGRIVVEALTEQLAWLWPASPTRTSVDRPTERPVEDEIPF